MGDPGSCFACNGNFAYNRKEKQGSQMHHDNAGPCGRGIEIGNRKPDEKTHHRDQGGTQHNGFEFFAQAHGCEGGEDNQAGNKQRANHPHTQYDSYRR